jgi:hypothetical protein
MICPDCDGSGRIRKRLLIFFTRRAHCPNCLGTGEFPPPGREVVRDRTRDRDDDRWPAASYGSTASDSHPREDDRFEVGSGGRSGGGGGGASWGGSDAPVIADPFASDSSSAVSSVTAGDAADSGSSIGGSSSSGDSGSGTSY